jgi:exo-beta-1,3-glucanase (GH17 family)
LRAFQRPFLVALIVLLLNMGLWALVNRGSNERPWGGQISCLSYSGYQAGDASNRLSDEDIDRDMALLSRYTGCIRTYGVSDGLDRIVSIAGRHKIDVMLGGWIGPDKAADNLEIDRLVEITKANPNVTRIVVGNETLLREDVKIGDMLDFIARVKRQVNIPVSTAEPWHIWLKYPELAEAVDFITVHILPYWEGLPIDGALDYVSYRWHQLQDAFPDKHILIGEVGWPSEGQWDKASEPSLINEARFIRDFLNMASANRFDYSLMEAIDAPWKRRLASGASRYSLVHAPQAGSQTRRTNFLRNPHSSRLLAPRLGDDGGLGGEDYLRQHDGVGRPYRRANRFACASSCGRI